MKIKFILQDCLLVPSFCNCNFLWFNHFAGFPRAFQVGFLSLHRYFWTRVSESFLKDNIWTLEEDEEEIIYLLQEVNTIKGNLVLNKDQFSFKLLENLDQWFSTFDSWRPTNQNKTKFADPCCTIRPLKYMFWLPESDYPRHKSRSRPTFWETLI